jgi:hypothetical protein
LVDDGVAEGIDAVLAAARLVSDAGYRGPAGGARVQMVREEELATTVGEPVAVDLELEAGPDRGTSRAGPSGSAPCPRH